MPRARFSLARILADLSRALRGLGVSWYVFGAQALALRGLPRATADLDVTVLLGSTATGELVAALRRAGFEPAFPDPTFIERTRIVPVRHVASGFPVDVVLGGPGLEELFAAGAERLRVGRVSIPVASATHLLVMKVLAARPKDLEDATSLLGALRGEIDEPEVDHIVRAIAEAIGEDDAVRALALVRARAAR